jgi:acyl-CoA thioesterase FadM
VEGKTRLVCVSLTGKPKRLPEEVKKRLDARAAADGQP